MSAEAVRLLALAATLLALAASAIVVFLHLAPTDVDSRIDGVSACALSRFGNLYRVQAVGKCPG